MNLPASRPSRLKPILITALIAAVIAAILYAYASPYLALKRLKQAVDARDAQAISAYVDFPALRTSLKQQVTEELMRRIDAQQRDNPLSIIGALIGSALIGPLVDAYATPDGVAALISGMPPRGQPGEQPPKLGAGAPAQASPPADSPPAAASTAPASSQPGDDDATRNTSPQTSAGYRNIDEFVVTYQRNAGGTRYAAIFHRSGLFMWKLSAVDLQQH
ncbi:DUF2939 domain-containing protein [Burkholderia alba]|uniref:DUF2939 domain-containing protein n=1 Tax=Burkholderia alba TaxID=2683677 RepID=UPI002B05FD16|nr:DUF2939 domain-containing protein [Burkholderia alba]